MHAPPTYSHHHSNQVDTCSVPHHSSHDPNIFQDSRSPASQGERVMYIHVDILHSRYMYEGRGPYLTHFVIMRTHNVAYEGSVVEGVFN